MTWRHLGLVALSDSLVGRASLILSAYSLICTRLLPDVGTHLNIHSILDFHYVDYYDKCGAVSDALKSKPGTELFFVFSKIKTIRFIQHTFNYEVF